MDEKRQSTSPKASGQPPLPTFHRQNEFLIWLQNFLFVCIFLGIGAYQLSGLNTDYWKNIENDFIHYSKRISPIAPEIVRGNRGFETREMLDTPAVQNIKGAIFIFDANFNRLLAAGSMAGNDINEGLQKILLSNLDRVSRMPNGEFEKLDHFRIYKIPLQSGFHMIFMLSPPSLWARIADRLNIVTSIFYIILLIVFISIGFLTFSRFINPSKKLTEFIIAKQRGISTDPSQLTSLPQEWKPWFNIISWVFERIGILEAQKESTTVDQQLGTNLLRRFSWVFERNENLTRELTAKNIDLKKEIEQHKTTTLELKHHRDHLNEMVRERATDLYHTNKKLEAAIQHAETANQAKSQFLANMSHSIRTPLNAMIGFTELLSETQLNETQLDFVETIKNSSETLLNLVNDILDLSKVESDGISLESIDFSIELMAYDICEMLRAIIGKKKVELACRIDSNVPTYVKGDSHRFQQILLNLLNNATKFTETGEILFAISVDQEETDKVLIHCKIKDTGIGIPQEKMELIFNPFQQADGSTTRQYGGTGLGLPIARKLAVLMNGNILLESEVDVGSTFHFTAWLEKSLKKEPWQDLTVGLSGKQVLIVDDNQANLDMLANALKSAGILAIDLKNGFEVIPTIERSVVAGKPFDCCLIDIHIPGMDGYEIARNIRASKNPLIAKMPLIASSRTADREPVLFAKAGFNQSFIKPVRREKLFQILREVLIQGGSTGSKEMFQIANALPTSESVIHRKVRILVAEDNAHNQKLIKIMLEKLGCFVTIVSNGREAVDQFSDTPNYYDLIFLDIQMPIIDGFGAFRIIRKINPTVPVIAFSAHAMKEHQEQSLKAGMNDFLAKPIRKEALLKVINKYAPSKSNMIQ
jgi:two-component system sensor histidine kinase/response regulator